MFINVNDRSAAALTAGIIPEVIIVDLLQVGIIPEVIIVDLLEVGIIPEVIV